MRILLVDDSRTIRDIQKKTFAQFGHSDAMEAADGVEALKQIGETCPDLVLIDWNMPNMDGITLVRKIRETDKTLPLIMSRPGGREVGFEPCRIRSSVSRGAF